MGDRQTYAGSCHCGAVRFEVETDLSGLGDCNCSMCSRLGWVMQSVPEADFRLLSGADRLTTYRFNTEAIAHEFCAICGIESFARGANGEGQRFVTINTACLAGVPDIARANVKHWDGRSW